MAASAAEMIHVDCHPERSRDIGEANGSPQSKDPMHALKLLRPCREFSQCTRQHRENALTRYRCCLHHRDPSTALAFASRTPPSLRRTAYKSIRLQTASPLPTSRPYLPSAGSSPRSTQSSSPGSSPSIVLATDRLMNVVEAFVVHQPVAMVFAAEAFGFASLMLKRPPVHAVRHANVKRSRTAAHDVNEILVISHKPINLSS